MRGRHCDKLSYRYVYGWAYFLYEESVPHSVTALLPLSLPLLAAFQERPVRSLHNDCPFFQSKKTLFVDFWMETMRTKLEPVPFRSGIVTEVFFVEKKSQSL
jgi:hypothetical protein